ncbi:MAG: orotidine-5'-phosphate decarboxylase [Candidatus Moraniibacteriota bacterium]
MNSKLCLALDGLPLSSALVLAKALGPRCYAVKAHELHDAHGPVIIDALKQGGAKRIWIDYKTHDTPDTVALRVKSLVWNGADIVTVHASGGVLMMCAAVEAARIKSSASPAEIWAITVLTSLGSDEIARIYGADRTPQQIVLDLALMAKEAGVTGLVCSAQEVVSLRECQDLNDMKLVVPGTRSVGVALGNSQKRSGTPAQTIADGATLLVAGSQVTRAADPVEAFNTMADEIGMDRD